MKFINLLSEKFLRCLGSRKLSADIFSVCDGGGELVRCGGGSRTGHDQLGANILEGRCRGSSLCARRRSELTLGIGLSLRRSLAATRPRQRCLGSGDSLARVAQVSALRLG